MPLIRRSPATRDKPHRCDYPGCDKSFFERQSLLRHQTFKHGRAARRRCRFLQLPQEPGLQQVPSDSSESPQN